MTTTLSPVERVSNGGRLIVTSGIREWIATGVEPYQSEPNENTLGHSFRQHHIAVLVTEHLSCSQLDTCDEDFALNQDVYNNPGCGGRIISVWHRNGASKIFCISEDWGGPDAYTTVLFAAEY